MCDWCGHEHSREQLCSKRPTWGRRGFLTLFGAGLIGATLPGVSAARDVAVSTGPIVWALPSMITGGIIWVEERDGCFKVLEEIDSIGHPITFHKNGTFSIHHR